MIYKFAGRSYESPKPVEKISYTDPSDNPATAMGSMKSVMVGYVCHAARFLVRQPEITRSSMCERVLPLPSEGTSSKIPCNPAASTAELNIYVYIESSRF